MFCTSGAAPQCWRAETELYPNYKGNLTKQVCTVHEITSLDIQTLGADKRWA